MKAGDFRKKIKKNKFIFFTYKKLTDNDYRMGLNEYKRGNTLKSKETVKKEISLIRNYWKCDPMDYYRYRLFEKELSDDELLDYIPKYYFYNYYMPDVYGNIDLSITDSKIGMMNYFMLKNIDIPVTIAIVKRGILFDTLDNYLSYEDLVIRLLNSTAQMFFIKPDNGQGGKGIFTVKKIDNELYIDDKKFNRNYFRQKIKHKDFVIQEGIVQRSDFSKINPTSVNTLRVITQKINDVYRISVVVMRIGRNGSFVDNSCQGGISVNVDIETGKLNKYGYTEHTNERFDKHPDTNFEFNGFIINDWDKIKLQILDFANKAFEFPQLGWDIAFLENKISIIEINTYYALELLQCCKGGMRHHLNVYPQLYGN
jgi:hypothetical protein